MTLPRGVVMALWRGVVEGVTTDEVVAGGRPRECCVVSFYLLTRRLTGNISVECSRGRSGRVIANEVVVLESCLGE